MNLTYFNLDSVPVYEDIVRLESIEYMNNLLKGNKNAIVLPEPMKFLQRADVYAHYLTFLEKYSLSEGLTGTITGLPLHVFRCLLVWFSSSSLIEEQEQLALIQEDYDTQLRYLVAKENQDKNPLTQVLKKQKRIEFEELGWVKWAEKNNVKPMVIQLDKD